MSDTSQGDNWWMASDGKWYPPESHPSAQQAPPPPQPPAPGWWMASDGQWYPPAQPAAPSPSSTPTSPLATGTAPPGPWGGGRPDHWDPAPSSLAHAPTPKKKLSKSGKPVGRLGRTVQIISLVVIAGAVAIFFASMKSSVKIGGAVDEFLVTDPATVVVRVKVTNTRQKPVDNVGCTVLMGEGAFEGSNYVAWTDESRTLEPGQSDFFKVSVIIEDKGAEYVKSGTAECEGKEK